MSQAVFVRGIALAGIIAVGVMGIQGLGANAQSLERTPLFQSGMSPGEGKDVNLNYFVLPPGWVGSRHQHHNDVWMLILEGQLVVETESMPVQTFGPGDFFHEVRDETMQIRNLSAIKPVKFLGLEVAEPGAATVSPVE